MQAGRQAYGLAADTCLVERMRCVLACVCHGHLQFSCVCVCEGLQALLQNTPDMLVQRQPMMSAMLQCIVLDGAAEHATLLVSLAHQNKCEAVEPKSLAHVVSILFCEC